MKKLLGVVMSGVIAVSLLAGCGGNGGADDGTVTLEFFQFKSEAVGTYDQLIAKFEEEHPNIKIEQNNVPESDTVLLSRLSQNQIPEIVAMNGNSVYGEMARGGAFVDFTDDESTDNIIPAYIDMINQLADNGETNGLPHSANANTVLYNKTKFEELGLEIPTTWDELIEVAEVIEAAGETPFYSAYGEAWTALPPFNALASNLHGDDFFEKRHAEEITFADRYQEASEKMLTLLEYTDNDVFGTNYNQANSAFANGESVMYMQGVWAISQVETANPDIEIGAFALPASNNADENRLVSGVDTLLSISSKSEHPEEAKTFVNFLLEEENVQFYIDEQKLFSAVENVFQEDPTVADLQVHFEEGTITSFADHYYY
uniref:ABC transporter substrate-binding protein n=1 Tax=Halalkalibacter lacteus TaxID=3090663 RepID=UPI002FC892E2